MADSFWWALSAGLILLGLAGVVLPALPGTALILAGIVLGAWIDGFTRVGWFAVSTVAVLALLAWLMDYVAALLGAKRAGASRQGTFPGGTLPYGLTRRRRALQLSYSRRPSV